MARDPVLTLGVAYYPDYLRDGQLGRLPAGGIGPLGVEEHIALDLGRMRTDGIRAIRVGEFSWSHVEAEPGRLDFSRFLLTLDLARQHGLTVIFCTPTATPPKWLVDRHPDVLPKTRAGATIPFGSRRHYDVLNPDYQREAARITDAYATAVGSHPAVVGWQIDNELGHHGSAWSFTAHAAGAFRAWLEQRYTGDIEALNDAWFTGFWSQHYRSFAEVDLPLASWADQNPHLELDFRRFMTEAYVRFQRQQIEILRRKSPGRFLTHNLVPMLFDLCPWRMTEDLDVVGYDHYQVGPLPDPVQSAAQFNLMRSLKHGRRFLVLEQQPVQVNWQAVNRRMPLDWLLLWGAQAAFLGASAMYYFSWQRFAGGPEQYHDAVVPHDLRLPTSLQERMLESKGRFFAEIAQTFALEALPLPRRDVLIVQNIESFWAHAICAQSDRWTGAAEVERFQQLFAARGLGVAMAESVTSVPLTDYQLVVLPGYAFELDDQERAVLRAYLAGGGKLLSSPRTGFKRKDNQMSPWPLRLYGDGDFYFEDYGALGDGETETVTLLAPAGAAGGRLTGRCWAERIIIPPGSGWEARAHFTGGLYAGAPAVLVKPDIGAGSGVHMHLAFCPDVTDELADLVLGQLALASGSRAPVAAGVQLFPMSDGDRSFLGIINFSDQAAPVTLTGLPVGAELEMLEATCAPDLTLRAARSRCVAAGGTLTHNAAARSVVLVACVAPLGKGTLA